MAKHDNFTVQSERSVLFIVRGYPRLSETFIAIELEQIFKNGINGQILTLGMASHKIKHPIHERIPFEVKHLSQNFILTIKMFVASLFAKRVRKIALESLVRGDLRCPIDTFTNRIFYFMQAICFVKSNSLDIVKVHSFFLNEPATLGYYISRMLDAPLSCTAHAKDIYTLKTEHIAKKISLNRKVYTCTEYNARFLKSVLTRLDLSHETDKIEFVPHGIDDEYIRQDPLSYSASDGSNEISPVTIISVGRPVPKKGFDILMSALAMLPRDLHWRFVHVGPGGEVLERMLSNDEKFKFIARRVNSTGWLDKNAVVGLLRKSDIFCLASRVASNGDRDGRPNAIMEAQAIGLPCISTNVSAIPELIENNVDGILVDEGDVNQLRAALLDLIVNPELRERIGLRARVKAAKNYNSEINSRPLRSHLKKSA